MATTTQCKICKIYLSTGYSDLCWRCVAAVIAQRGQR